MQLPHGHYLVSETHHNMIELPKLQCCDAGSGDRDARLKIPRQYYNYFKVTFLVERKRSRAMK